MPFDFRRRFSEHIEFLQALVVDVTGPECHLEVLHAVVTMRKALDVFDWDAPRSKDLALTSVLELRDALPRRTPEGNDAAGFDILWYVYTTTMTFLLCSGAGNADVMDIFPLAPPSSRLVTPRARATAPVSYTHLTLPTTPYV